MDWKDRTIVFVLAAGLGKRLGSITHDRPKALVEINGMPLIEKVLKKIGNEGFRNCIVNVHHYADAIVQFLETNDNFGLNISISDESDELMDTGGAVLKAIPLMNDFDWILVHNVDIVTDLSLTAFCIDAMQDHTDAALAVRDRYSSRKLIFDQHMQLCGWHHQEKDLVRKTKRYSLPNHEYAFSGIHLLKKEMIAHLPVEKLSMIDLYLQLADHYYVKGILLNEGYWFDLGKQHQIDTIAQTLRQLGH